MPRVLPIPSRHPGPHAHAMHRLCTDPEFEPAPTNFAVAFSIRSGLVTRLAPDLGSVGRHRPALPQETGRPVLPRFRRVDACHQLTARDFARLSLVAFEFAGAPPAATTKYPSSRCPMPRSRFSEFYRKNSNKKLLKKLLWFFKKIPFLS